ncbi:MAG: aryl-sulfate sulfotransferase [Chloroflexota bacterium]
MRRLIMFGSLILLLATTVVGSAQEERTVGTLFGNHEGYTLYRTPAYPAVFLINDAGEIVHQWETSDVGRDAFLMPDGTLMYSAARQGNRDDIFGERLPWLNVDGRFEAVTWDGDLLWSYEFEAPGERVHHGFTPRPDGNILFMTYQQIDTETAVAAGRNPELLTDDLGIWTDVIYEYDPALDEIVWEWHAWDHLVQDVDPDAPNFGDPLDFPGRIDLNYTTNAGLYFDWLHSNSVAYNADLDQIIVSVPIFGEVWVIDRDTTTEEAAGPAGDLLYRWGNPEAYNAGIDLQTKLYWQHDAQWIPEGMPGAGNILVFDNRNPVIVPSRFSQVIEFTPPLLEDGTYEHVPGTAYGPENFTWLYTATPPEAFYSALISGTQRLPNGNTLIIEGTKAHMFEVTPEGETVWSYYAPFNGDRIVPQGEENDTVIFRARRYQPDYPAFDGRDLTPGDTIESMGVPAPATEEASE